MLLHGGLLTIDFMFGPMLPALAARRQVIAVELQGHGRTADTDRTMSVDQLADDVAALLAHLGIDEADVFGFSLGGLVGWSLVMRYPKVVGRLVVASADYRSREADPDEIPRPMPTDADFQAMRDAYEAVAPDPSHFDALAEKVSTMVNTHVRRLDGRSICGRCRPRRWCSSATTTSSACPTPSRRPSCCHTASSPSSLARPTWT